MGKDVEKLLDEKEQLRDQLKSMDGERQELQDNFMYVKDQLDKCQMKLSQDANDDVSKALEGHNTVLFEAREDRNSIAARLESALRDCEKEKVYHEQQLERL